MPRNRPPRDFFDNLIEVGDRYFYGSPAIDGVVKKITGKTMVLKIGEDDIEIGHSMKCASPEKGICLDKHSENTEYIVRWRMWIGADVHETNYTWHRQEFTDLKEARECFESKSPRHDRVTLKQISTRLIAKSDD